MTARAEAVDRAIDSLRRRLALCPEAEEVFNVIAADMRAVLLDPPPTEAPRAQETFTVSFA